MELAQSLNALDIKAATNIEIFAALIQNQHTDFVICTFRNSVTYIITQYGKIGNLYLVEREKLENGLFDAKPIYSVRTLLGGDNIESEVAARYITEQLKIAKPVVFSLTLKDFSSDTLKNIVHAIQNYHK